MAGLSITGQMKVSTLQDGFLKEFGLTLRIYDGRSFADPTQTLAQVRKKKGSGKALSVAKNMKVGNLEDKFEEEFGLKVQVAGSDDSYLCDNDLTLNGAQQEDEKKLGRKAKKASKATGPEDVPTIVVSIEQNDGNQDSQSDLIDLDEFPESTHLHLNAIQRMAFEEKKTAEEIASKLSIDELDVEEAMLVLEMNGLDHIDEGSKSVELSEHQSNAASTEKKERGEPLTTSARSISLRGFGSELIIGFIDEGEIEAISENDEDIHEIIDELSERNEFLQIYGPDVEDCEFLDESGEAIEIPQPWDEDPFVTKTGLQVFACSINMEVCTYFKGDLFERIDELVDDEDNLASKISSSNLKVDGPKIKDDLKQNFGNLFPDKPEKTKFLIQKHVEKGSWGSIDIDNNVDAIVLLTLEVEGYMTTLLGHFYRIDNKIEFDRYETDAVETHGTSDDYEIYDAANYETVWEG